MSLRELTPPAQQVAVPAPASDPRYSASCAAASSAAAARGEHHDNELLGLEVVTLLLKQPPRHRLVRHEEVRAARPARPVRARPVLRASDTEGR